MPDLERRPDQPDDINGLAEIERREQTTRDLIVKREQQAARYHNQADELRRQAGVYDELSSRTLARRDKLQTDLGNITKAKELYTETLVYLASSYRDDVFDKRRRLKEARLRVDAGQLHENVVTMQEAKLAELEQQAITSRDLQRGLTLLELREAAEAEARRKKITPPTKIVATPSIEAPRRVEEKEESLPRIMVRDVEQGTYTIGDTTVAYKPDSQENFILSILPSNPKHDPEVGFMSGELDQKSIQRKVWNHNSSSQTLDKINKKFRRFLEEPEDFRIIKGQGERGKMKYYIDAEILTPEEWERRQQEEEAPLITQPIELQPGEVVEIWKTGQRIPVELPNGQTMHVKGPNQKRAADFIEKVHDQQQTFTRLDLIIAAKGGIDRKRFKENEKYRHSLHVEARNLFLALETYYSTHDYILDGTIKEENLRGKAQQYELKETQQVVTPEQAEEIIATAQKEIAQATPEVAAKDIIGLEPKHLGSLVARARKRLDYSTSYEANEEVKAADQAVEDKLPPNHEPVNIATLGQNIADAFMKVGHLYLLPEDQRKQVLAQYDAPTQILLTWLMQEPEKFYEMFRDLYYPMIVPYVDTETRKTLRNIYEEKLSDREAASTTKPASKPLRAATPAEGKQQKISTIEQRDPDIQKDIKNFVAEIGKVIPKDKSYKGDMIRAAIDGISDPEWKKSYGTSWAQQSRLDLLAEKDIITPTRHRDSGDYHLTYTREDIVKAWYVLSNGKALGGLTPTLLKQLSNIIDDKFNDFDEQEVKKKQKNQ